MTAIANIPVRMSVAEFLDWSAGVDGSWQLVDGEPVAMAPPSDTHAAVLNEAGRLIGNHLLASVRPGRVLSGAGVQPHLRSRFNLRIPDLVVTCTTPVATAPVAADPVLVVEVLSPNNEAQTGANVWSYTTIPSVREVLVLRPAAIGAELLRRQPDGGWPREPDEVLAGPLTLPSIGMTADVAAFYRTTHLAPGAA